MKRSKRDFALLGVLGLMLAFVSSPAFSGPIEYTFSTTGLRFIDPLLTGLTSVSGSFIYENAAAHFRSDPNNGTAVYNAMIGLSGSADGNSFTDSVGVVAVLDEGPPGDLLIMHKGSVDDFNGFTFAGMPLEHVVFFWQEVDDDIDDFLDDQSLPSVLPPTVGGGLRLTFVDAGGVWHHAIFNVSVVPGLPVSTPKLNFQGQLAIIEEDNGSGIYSGVPIGSTFSIEIDLVTRNGFISDSTTATAFFVSEEEATNDLVLDAFGAELINSVTGTSFIADDIVDVISLSGEALTSGGGSIDITVFYILDSLAFNEEGLDSLPPDPGDILTALFLFDEENDLGEEIYSGAGNLQPTIASFTFQKIVDTDTLMPSYPGTFGGFSGSGNAFSAPTFDGSSLGFIGHNNGAHGYKAVYIVNGGTFDLIVDTNTPIPGDSELNFRDFNSGTSSPLSHSGGNVVFWGGARFSPVPQGIYTNIGGSINIVADLNTPIPNGTGNFARLFSVPVIDGANMVFSGGNDTQEGIYTVIGGTLQVVADLNTPIPGGTGIFDNLAFISPGIIVDIEGSDVVFRYVNASSTEGGIYTTVGGTLRLVADYNTPIPGQNQTFTSLTLSQIDGGDIVFSGGTGSTKGLYLDSGGQLSVLVDTDTPVPEDSFGRTFHNFLGFSAYNGRLAFIGSKVDENYVERWGLYFKPGGDLIKVLDSYDLLDGKTPWYFYLARRGLSGNDIAFKVAFTDGSEGIFVAHFSPANEPPTAEAGASQSVHVGQTVNLDGSGSSDDNTASGDLQYAWSFSSVPAGSTATLTGATTATPTFIPDLPGAYVVKLIVNDGLVDSAPDEITVTVISGEIVPPTATVYEDGQDGTTSGWSVYDTDPSGAVVVNIFDDVRQSRVIELSGSGTSNGYRLRSEDGSKWRNLSQSIAQWSMAFSENFTIYFDVETTDGQRYLYYTPVNRDGLGDGRYVHHGLGSNMTDGQWRTVVRDLRADLQDAQPGVTLLEVNGFYVRGSGRVDDIRLLDEPPPTVYEDAEDGTTSGWSVYDTDPSGAVVVNVFDDVRQSRVIELSGSGTSNGYRLRSEDGSKWRNSSQFIAQWSMAFSESFTIYIDVETTDGQRYLNYTPLNHDGLGDGRYVHHGLGSTMTDGQWRTVVRDLRADLQDAQPGVTLLEVNGFYVRGSGRVDDIRLLDELPPTVYEDAEDGTTSGWSVYDTDPSGAVVVNVFDDVRQSRVIEFSGSGTTNGYRLRNEDGSKWRNRTQFIAEWWMAFSENFTVYIDVETSAGQRYLYYTPVDHDGLGDQKYVHHGLGLDVTDGQWRTIVRDLQADLNDAQVGVTLLEVNGIFVRGSGRVDDIALK